jgi:carbon storage regulator
MLVLSRKVDQTIVIEPNITIRILEINGDRVKLGINAPRDVVILRQELQEEVRQENLRAAARGEDAGPLLGAVGDALARGRPRVPRAAPTAGP